MLKSVPKQTLPPVTKPPVEPTACQGPTTVPTVVSSPPKPFPISRNSVSPAANVVIMVAATLWTPITRPSNNVNNVFRSVTSVKMVTNPSVVNVTLYS